MLEGTAAVAIGFGSDADECYAAAAMTGATSMMRGARRWQLAALLAVFWFAQVQAVVHEIGHLNDAVGVVKTLGTPKAQNCPECLALAQSGAAPISSVAVCVAINIDRHEPPTTLTAIVGHAPPQAYQSRAPPFSLI